MRRVSQLCGFRVSEWTRFKLQRRTYRVGHDGCQTLNLLVEITDSAREGRHESARLLPYRAEFRRIVRGAPAALLSYLVLRTSDDGLRRLAIWLRGRCHGTTGTWAIARQTRASNPLVRREAVRALQRMRAWSSLREVEAVEADPGILRLAKQRPPAEFDERMQSFLAAREPLPVAPRLQQLRLAEGLTVRRTPPKSRDYIRAILRRIRQLVRGPFR